MSAGREQLSSCQICVLYQVRMVTYQMIAVCSSVAAKTVGMIPVHVKSCITSADLGIASNALFKRRMLAMHDEELRPSRSITPMRLTVGNRSLQSDGIRIPNMIQHVAAS